LVVVCLPSFAHERSYAIEQVVMPARARRHQANASALGALGRKAGADRTPALRRARLERRRHVIAARSSGSDARIEITGPADPTPSPVPAADRSTTTARPSFAASDAPADCHTRRSRRDGDMTPPRIAGSHIERS